MWLREGMCSSLLQKLQSAALFYSTLHIVWCLALRHFRKVLCQNTFWEHSCGRIVFSHKVIPYLRNSFPSLLPPLHLLYHCCINSCVMVEPERGKGSQSEAAAVITGFINPHWMSCLWMRRYQTAFWLNSNCLLSERAKTVHRGSSGTTCRHTHTKAHSQMLCLNIFSAKCLKTDN